MVEIMGRGQHFKERFAREVARGFKDQNPFVLSLGNESIFQTRNKRIHQLDLPIIKISIEGQIPRMTRQGRNERMKQRHHLDDVPPQQGRRRRRD